jgi:hypothetical protein
VRSARAYYHMMIAPWHIPSEPDFPEGPDRDSPGAGAERPDGAAFNAVQSGISR